MHVPFSYKGFESIWIHFVTRKAKVYIEKYVNKSFMMITILQNILWPLAGWGLNSTGNLGHWRCIFCRVRNWYEIEMHCHVSSKQRRKNNMLLTSQLIKTLPWRHNGRDGVSSHQPYDCLLDHLFRRRSKKTSKIPITGLCAGNSPVTGDFPAQSASNAENISIWWRHHGGWC